MSGKEAQHKRKPRIRTGDLRLGIRLRDLRKKRPRYTQGDVAKNMHIKIDKLRLFETGKQMPTPDEITRFCRAAEVTNTDAQDLLALYRMVTTDAGVVRPRLRDNFQRIPLMLGGRETNFVILDGTGLQAIPYDNARIEMNAEEPNVELPLHLMPQLNIFYEEYRAEIERRRRGARARHIPHNGDITSVHSITISRTRIEELPQWNIFSKKHTYYRYMSLRKNLDTMFEYNGEQTSLRKLYLSPENFDPYHPPPFLNFIGVSSMVYLTDENRLVIVKRGETEVYPDAFGASAGEMVNYHKDIRQAKPGDNVANRAAQRSLVEELGDEFEIPFEEKPPEPIIEQAIKETTSLLSFGFTQHDCQYELLGLHAVSGLSFEDLRASAEMAQDGKYEIAGMYYISARPAERAFRELFELTNEHGLIWPPTPLATVLLALRFLNPKTYSRYDKILRDKPEYFGVPIPFDLLIPELPPHTGI
jgi:Helix-turn-helix domain